MQAAPAYTGPQSAKSVAIGLATTAEQIFTELKYRWRRLPKRQQLLAVTLFAGFAVLLTGLVAGPRMMGYVSLFGLSVLTNAVLFIPSGRGPIMLATAFTLNPWIVSIVSGIGGGIGEISGYAIGRSSKKLIKDGKRMNWLIRVSEGRMGLTIFAISIIPSPLVDTIAIVAGRLGYPLKRFLFFAIIGKVIQCFIIVYLALWNYSLISSWLGLS